MKEEAGENAREYELSYLVGEAAEAERVLEIISSHEGEVAVKGQPTNIRLAYPIKKQLSAWFGFVYFSALPEAAGKIGAALKTRPSVIRSILISSPAKTQMRETRKQRVPEPKPEASQPALTNEALEQKLEEILK